MNPYSASDSSLRDEFASSSKSLRASRKYFWFGIAGILFFSMLAVFEVMNCLENKDRSIPNPNASAIFTGTIFAFFITLSAFLVRFYFKYRLYVDDLSVVQVGVFTTKSLRVADIQLMTWRNRSAGGSVIIKSDSQKLGIEFDSIERSALNELVSKIRQLVPSDNQVGWDKFKHKHTPVAK